MKPKLSVFLCLLIASGHLLAQSPFPSSKPQIEITIISDGKPTTQQTGMKAATKQIRFKALLNTASTDSFSDYKSELLIKDVQILLTRNGRKVAQTNAPDGHLSSNLIQSAHPNDHVSFVFTLAAQRKNGELVSLPEQPTYNFLVRL